MRKYLGLGLSVAAIAVITLLVMNRQPVGQAGPESTITGFREGATVDPFVRSLVEERQNAIRRSPERAELRCELALLFEANEYWAEAIKAYNHCFELGETSSLWQYHQTLCLRSKGENDVAEKRLRNICAENPDFGAAQFRLGQWLLESGSPREALSCFEKAASMHPEAVEPQVGWGASLVALEEFDQAMTILEPAVRRDPQYKPGLYALGLAYRGVGRRDEARQLMQRGLDGEPRFLADPKTQSLLSQTVSLSGTLDRAMRLTASGQAQLAVETLQARMKKVPDEEQVLASLANAYRELKELDKAIQWLEKAIDLNPDYFAAHLNMSICKMDVGDLETAEKHARKAVSINPNVGDTHFALARVLARRNDMDGSWESLQAASKLDVENPELYFALGETAGAMKKYDEARGYYTKASQLQPQNPQVWIKLAVTCVATSDREAAWEAHAAAKRLAPNHPSLARLQSLIERMPTQP